MPRMEKPNLLDPDKAEIKNVADAIRRSKGFKHAHKQLALFTYLFKNRNRPCTAHELWKHALEEHGGSEKNVRTLAHQLRMALLDYSRGVRKGMVILLPRAHGRDQGWQLEFIKKGNDTTATWRFWSAHVDDDLEIYIVYASRLFYRALDQPFVFRFYDCNAEDADKAKALLKRTHPEMFEAHMNRLLPSFPYVPWGELVARDQIKSWFSKYAGIDARTFNPHRMSVGHSLWDESLILLGSASVNGMIQKVLSGYPRLPIKIGGVEGISDQVVINAPTAEEKRKIAEAKVSAKYSGTNVTLSTTADGDHVLAVVMRVPSPHHQGPITILNSGFGAALEQLAEIVTRDDKMNSFFRNANLPQYFQAVFTASILDRDAARPLMKLVAMRTVKDVHLISD